MGSTGATGFVQRRHDQLLLDDCPFFVCGANCYYFAFSSEAEQTAILDLAASFGFNTLRIWAFSDSSRTPSADTSSISFQYLQAGSTAPELVDSEAGLVRLDRAVKLAGERGIRLILTLTNYHADYGGLPEYQRWLNLQDPLDVYRDPLARITYRSYTQQIITRRNTLTGVAYSDDPAILAWEIANEPRAPGDPNNCDLLTQWMSEMSAHIRTLSPNQLIAAGDEGFFNRGLFSRDWLYNGSCGVDSPAIMSIPQIDLGTFHLYPTQWSKGDKAEQFGVTWIQQHLDAAKSAGKPVLLEEFGMPASSARESVYAAWVKVIEEQKCAGDLVWMIGLPGKGDEYLLSDAAASPVIRDHAHRYATR